MILSINTINIARTKKQKKTQHNLDFEVASVFNSQQSTRELEGV